MLKTERLIRTFLSKSKTSMVPSRFFAPLLGLEWTKQPVYVASLFRCRWYKGSGEVDDIAAGGVISGHDQQSASNLYLDKLSADI